MAMIFCPECGKQVSDRANVCPNCAFPISESRSFGQIKVKLVPLTASSGFSGNQSATISAGGQVLWEGKVGQVAELQITQPTTVTVKYHMSAMHYGGSVQGVIDPNKGNKYCVSARQGMMRTVLAFQIVDVFDSD